MQQEERKFTHSCLRGTWITGTLTLTVHHWIIQIRDWDDMGGLFYYYSFITSITRGIFNIRYQCLKVSKSRQNVQGPVGEDILLDVHWIQYFTFMVTLLRFIKKVKFKREMQIWTGRNIIPMWFVSIYFIQMSI